MSGVVRRSPYPADARFTVNSQDVEVLLARGTKGQAQLVEQKMFDLSNVSPTDYRYRFLNPLREMTQGYETLSHGYGLDVQQDFADQLYSYALGLDASTGYIQKGPAFTTITPASTGVFAPCFGFELGGVLYGLAGRYVLVRGGDTAGAWTVSKDLTAGKLATGAATFYSAASAANLAFVAVSGANAWWFNGAAWTQYATFTAIDFAVTGRQFYRAHDVNLLNLCDLDADPTNEANWTTSYTIGDKSSAIQRLAVANDGTLLVLKTDGVYTLNGAGDPHQFWPFMKFAPSSNNGKIVGPFMNDIYTSYDGDFYKITPDVTLLHVGPERLANNSSAVRGPVTAFAGVGALFGLAGLRNVDSGDGYTLKWGGFAPDPQGELQRFDAWHGSISRKFSGVYAVAAFTSAIGAPDANHTRTYFGFSDGSLGWVINPCTPNPAACAAYRFLVGDDTLDLPDQHFAFRSYTKNLRGWTVDSPNLAVTRSATISYRQLNGGTYLSLPTFNVAGGQRQNFPANSQAKYLGVRLTLSNSLNTESPVIHSMFAHTQLRIDRIMSYQTIIQAADGLHKRNGTPFHRGAAEFTDAVEAAVDVGSVPFTLPDGKSLNLSIIEYSKTLGWDREVGQWEAGLQITGIDFATLSILGTVDRVESLNLTIDQVEALGYSIDDMDTL